MVKKMKWPVPANLSLTRQSLGSIGKNRNPTKNPEGGVLGQETAKNTNPEGLCLGQGSAKANPEGLCLGQGSAKANPEGLCLGQGSTKANPEGLCLGQGSAKNANPEGLCLGQGSAKANPEGLYLGQGGAKANPEGLCLGQGSAKANPEGLCLGHIINLGTEPPIDSTPTMPLHLAQKPCCSKSLNAPQQIQTKIPQPLMAETARINKCGNRSCKLCPYLLTVNTAMSKLSKRKHLVYGNMSCQTQRLVYLLQCARCGRQYVGQTVNTLANRATKHLQEVRRGGSSKLQLHYNGEGHTPHDMRFQPLAKVGDDLTPSEAETQLKKLETMWIKRLGTMQPVGLNYVLEDTRQRVL